MDIPTRYYHRDLCLEPSLHSPTTASQQHAGLCASQLHLPRCTTAPNARHLFYLVSPALCTSPTSYTYK